GSSTLPESSRPCWSFLSSAAALPVMEITSSMAQARSGTGLGGNLRIMRVFLPFLLRMILAGQMQTNIDAFIILYVYRNLFHQMHREAVLCLYALDVGAHDVV